MAQLQHCDDTSQVWLLSPRFIVGRASGCQICLSDPRVSGEHAMLRWRGGTWQLQDLNSRNGTFLDGNRLEPGESVGLCAGSVLSFGRAGNYELIDAGPPTAHAVASELPYRVIESQANLLALPEGDAPEFMVLRDDDRWWLETHETREPISDGHLLTTREGSWRLSLPELLEPTQDSEEVGLSLTTLELRFCVDPRGRCTGLSLHRGARSVELKPRTHHAPLLALARIRLRAQAQSQQPARAQGWISQDELLEQLDYDSSRLHVEVYRSRRQLAKAGIVDAARIVERRPSERMLRLGVSSIVIVEDAPS